METPVRDKGVINLTTDDDSDNPHTPASPSEACEPDDERDVKTPKVAPAKKKRTRAKKCEELQGEWALVAYDIDRILIMRINGAIDN